MIQGDVGPVDFVFGWIQNAYILDDSAGQPDYIVGRIPGFMQLGAARARQDSGGAQNVEPAIGE